MTAEPAAHGQARPGPVRRLLARGLVRAGIVTYVFSGLTMVAYLFSKRGHQRAGAGPPTAAASRPRSPR